MEKSKLDCALELAARGFYVFPIVEGKKAPPRMEGWQRFATREPNKIADMWRSHPNDNIGIYTAKFGDTGALLVVDVDSKENKRGAETMLQHELEGRELPDTYTVNTATGGRHHFYSVPSPVRQGANVLGEHVDVRSKGGFVVAEGSSVVSGSYNRAGENTTVVAAPEWVVSLCGKPRTRAERPDAAAPVAALDQDRAAARATQYLQNEAPIAIEGQAGDETTFKVACRVKDFGVDWAQCVELMLTHWNERCTPGWTQDDLVTKVRNAYAYGLDTPGIAAPETEFTAVGPNTGANGPTDVPKTDHPFEKLNKEFAFVLVSGSGHILWETTDHEGKFELKHLSMSGFHQKFAADKLMIGRTEKPVTQLWMEHKGRRSFDGVVFRPGQEAPARFYNLWRGFAVEPAQTQEPHPALDAFLDHALTNVCGGNTELHRWLIGYFAHLVQKPWDKPLTALVFKGGKGVGKNALVERIGFLLGHHFLLTSNKRYLTGNFTSHLENLLMFVLDEAFWSGDKGAEGQLKDLITGSHHVVEYKGEEPFTVDNKTRVIIIGNEDWLVPASHDERRFAVFDVGSGRRQDRAYFQQMREGMESGGYRQLLRYLLDYDISGLEFNQAPATRALTDQKHASLEPVHEWWFDCLNAGRIVGSDFGGDWPTTDVDPERVRQSYRRYVKDRNVRSRSFSNVGFGHQLRKVCPGLKHPRVRVGGELGYVYQVPTLSACREAWCSYIGDTVVWPE